MWLGHTPLYWPTPHLSALSRLPDPCTHVIALFFHCSACRQPKIWCQEKHRVSGEVVKLSPPPYRSIPNHAERILNGRMKDAAVRGAILPQLSQHRSAVFIWHTENGHTSPTLPRIEPRKKKSPRGRQTETTPLWLFHLSLSLSLFSLQLKEGSSGRQVKLGHRTSLPCHE